MEATNLPVLTNPVDMEPTLSYLAGALIALIILVYLVYALIKPEKF